MKTTKLMLSAFVAVLAIISCNKQDTTPDMGPKTLKSIEVSLENVILTKGIVEDAVANGDKITVNDFQLFLLDINGNEYVGKVTDGSAEAQSYWGAGLPADGKASFHYVDPNCTKVVAVANMGKQYASYAELKAELTATPLAIAGQQNPKDLALYAEDTSFDAAGTHVDNGTDADGNAVQYQQQVFEVDLVLKPRISRFEVDGFSVIPEDPANPKYAEVKITQLAFQNYYPAADLLATEVTTSGALVTPITDFSNQSAVYTWLDGIATPNTDWFRDACGITLNAANDYVQDLPATGKLAYHAFSTTETPVFVLKLEVDGQPAYLYTKDLKDSNGTVTEFQPGYIYRMSGEGEVPGSNGTIEIPEEKIDPMDRCLDITVDVMSWEVVLVTPEF